MRDRVVTHYFRELATILCADGPLRLRRRLFVSYTRVTWRYVLAMKFSRKTTSPVRIGAFTVWPADFGSFRHLFEEVFIRRIYDVPLETNTPCIIDCGSNIGMSLVFFKEQYPLAEFTAFEPDPENFRRLQSTAAANFPTATIHNVALGDKPGLLQLYSTTDGKGSTTKSLYKELLDGSALVSERVDVVRLSAYLKSPVDLLKIDVEGAETSILRDLVSSRAIRLVKHMIVEFHEVSRGGKGSLSQFLTALQTEGFSFTFSSQPPRSTGHIDVRTKQHVLIYASRSSGDEHL